MRRKSVMHSPAIALIPLLALVVGLGGSAGARAAEESDEFHMVPHQVGNITIDGGLTWFLQATDGAPTNTTVLTYTLDLIFEAPVSRHGRAVVALEAGDGLGVDPVINPLSVVNYDASYTNITSASPDSASAVVPSVSQAYYEGNYHDGRLIANVGKLDVHAATDDNAYANDETKQFMSGMFVRSAGTTFAELDRYYAPGIYVRYALTKAIDVSGVAANGNGSGFDDVFDYPYLAAQLNFKPGLGGRNGNYRFYVISDSRHNAYTKINGGATTSNTGWGLSFDQALNQNVGVFARYSRQDDDIAQNTVKGSWSLGAVLQGALWGRPSDSAGIGYGRVLLNDKADLATALGTTNTGDESHLEAYYEFGIVEHFSLTADVQVLTNLGGNAAADTVTVTGIRGQLDF